MKQSRIRRELVSLTTAAFLACFKRFVSRRGLPSDVCCDNASNFKGANNQLKELFALQSSTEHQNQVQSFETQKRITFHFIPSFFVVCGRLQ